VSQDTIDPRLNDISSSLYRVAVKAVIVKNHALLLVKERDDDWWSLPGGGIDHGETPSQALIRELVEELGIDPAGIRMNPQIIAATTALASSPIPRASLFFEVSLPGESFEPTTDVETSGWFSMEEVKHLPLSPFTGNIMELVATYLQ
jgi:8-oxo-dGTP pyrophosphatase MutT (NUDIX family)